MAEISFCPNCGHKVSSDDEFCPNCGTRLKSSTTPNSDEQQPQQQTQSNQTNTTQPAGNNGGPQKQVSISKKMLGIIIAVVVILIGGFLFLRNYYTPQNQLNRTMTALSTKNGSLAKHVATDDPTLKNKIDAKSVKPMQTYFSNNKEKLADLKSALENGQSYDNNTYTFQQDGHAWLFFPKYKLYVRAAYAKLKTNHSDVSLYQGSKKLKTTTSNSKSYKVGPVFPGTYTFKSDGTISGRHLVNKSTVNLTSGSNDVNLELKTATFTVRGNNGSIVYLNGKKVGKIGKNGKMKFTNYPMSGDLRAYVTMVVNGKTIKSKTIDVAKELEYSSNTITPMFSGVVGKSDAQELLQQAYSGTQYGSSDSNTADLFVGAESNSGYNELIQFFDSFDSDQSYDVEVTDVTGIVPDGNKSATVSYQVKYTFYKDNEKKVQQFTYNGAKIVKSGGYYKISAIGKTGTSPDWEKDYPE